MSISRPLRYAALLVLAGATACGSGSSGYGAPASSASATSAPGASFSTTSVPGVGTVVVDARGRTVYVLTSGHHDNLPCTDASGCTGTWPDLPLPDGVAKATAGAGIQATLLASKKSSDGETYPTYHGWLMYEYAGDSGPGQANGQGLRSYGGTWYALSANGDPVTSSASPAATGNGGYGYHP